MNLDPLETNLRETLWRRPLTPAEQAELDARLAAHPEERADWAAEQALNAALTALPAPPVASNFTARVLAAVEREDLATAGARSKTGGLGWLRSWGWWPRAAVAVVILGLGLATWRGLEQQRQTQALARLAAATEATPLPPTEVFQEFDTVMKLMPSGMADVGLLTLMQ